MKNVVNNVEKRGKEKLFNFRPALFAAIFLVFGVVYGYYGVLRGASAWWLLALLPVPTLTLAFARDKRGLLLRGLALLVMGIFFICGFFAFRAQIRDFQSSKEYYGEATVLGSVIKSSEKDGEKVLYLAEVYIDGDRVEGQLVAYLPSAEAKNIGVGDEVLVRGEVWTDDEPMGEYGFRAEEITAKRRYRLTGDSCVLVGRSDDLFLRMRARIERVTYAGMDETPAALTVALLTGDTTGVDGELTENMRRGGIIHIFAVSGLNVGALYLFCLVLFAKTPLRKTPKPVRYLLLLGVLFFYSGTCGFSASVVRAAIFCACAYFVKLLGASLDMLNALGVAAILILLRSPSELFGAGFQLSFLACVGLFLLAKPISRLLDKGWNAARRRIVKEGEEEKRLREEGELPVGLVEGAYRAIRAVFSATVAAQITTAPALLIHFGYLSGWALLLNVFFVPLIDGMFTLLLLFVLLAAVLPVFCSLPILYIPSVVWSTLILLFETVDFSSFALTGITVSAGLCVCYFAGIICLSDKLNLTKRRRLGLALSFFAVVLAGILLLNL